MLSSAVTTKGQVTIPAELREKFGIKPGDRVAFAEDGGHIVLQRQENAVTSVFGIVKARRSVSLQDMDAAVAAGRSRHARR
jgi:AbrB family looped-hinge helix DNA binding protein